MHLMQVNAGAVSTIVYIVILPLALLALVTVFALEDNVLKEVEHDSPSLRTFRDDIENSKGRFRCECTGEKFNMADFNPWLNSSQAARNIFAANKDKLCQMFAEGGPDDPHPPGCEDIISLSETVRTVRSVCNFGETLLGGMIGLLRKKGFSSPVLLSHNQLEKQVSGSIDETTGALTAGALMANMLDEIATSGLARAGLFGTGDDYKLIREFGTSSVREMLPQNVLATLSKNTFGARADGLAKSRCDFEWDAPGAKFRHHGFVFDAQLFDKSDTNSDGKLDHDEFRAVLVGLSANPWAESKACADLGVVCNVYCSFLFAHCRSAVIL